VLIGFPSEYSAVTHVTIQNTTTTTTTTISGTPTLTGYYVFYENSYSSGFWPDLASQGYANVVQVQQNAGICGGLVFGNHLTFTYVISGVSNVVTYTPVTSINVGDGYQYQQFNGQTPFSPPSDFQWGGSGGSQSWGTQTGTGTQTYAQWQAVVPASYQYNSIYKYLYPYTSS